MMLSVYCIANLNLTWLIYLTKWHVNLVRVGEEMEDKIEIIYYNLQNDLLTQISICHL